MRRGPLLLVLMLAPLGPARAGEGPAMEAPEIVESWGRVMFCRSAYRNPLNAGRVYAYDTEECARAERFVAEAAAAHPDPARLRSAARERMDRIHYATPDIAAVLRSCREQCRALADRQQATAAGPEATPGSPGDEEK